MSINNVKCLDCVHFRNPSFYKLCATCADLPGYSPMGTNSYFTALDGLPCYKCKHESESRYSQRCVKCNATNGWENFESGLRK